MSPSNKLEKSPYFSTSLDPISTTAQSEKNPTEAAATAAVTALAEDDGFIPELSKNHDINCTEEKRRGSSDYKEDAGLDPGYCWLILFFAVIFLILTGALTFSSGVLVVEFRDTFDASPTSVSLMSALICGMAFGAAPLGSFVSNRYSHRLSIMTGCIITSVATVCSSFASSLQFLLLTYGFIGGVGLALVYTPAVSVVGFYFIRRRRLALGLVVAGGALGSTIFPPILRLSLDIWSWREVFVMLAAFAMQCCVFAALLLPAKCISKPSVCTKQYSQRRRNSSWREITNFGILFDPTFAIQVINNLLWCIAISLFWILLPDYARESNMSKSQGAFLTSIASISNVFGRGLAAIVTHLLPNKILLSFHSISTILGGIFLALYPINQSFYFFACITCCVGTMYGMMVGSLAMITSDLYGADMLTSAYGYLMVADGLGFIVGPPVAGWMFELSSSYDVAFIAAGATYALAGIIMFLTKYTKNRNFRETNDTNQYTT